MLDRKSTRLNSSHLGISYAVFCLKKKRKTDVYDAPLTGLVRHRRSSHPRPTRRPALLALASHTMLRRPRNLYPSFVFFFYNRPPPQASPPFPPPPLFPS